MLALWETGTMTAGLPAVHADRPVIAPSIPAISTEEQSQRADLP
jgi:hypothetical protein